MHIDIISDVICPWCYIGKRRLERALAARPEFGVEITWRPFQLNPEMPAGGMPRDSYLATKFGGAGHAARLYRNLSEAGATVGISFAFERIPRTPNSLDAHRLIRHAAAERRTNDIVDGLFRAYFVEGRDIGDRATLAHIAGEAGLDRAAAAAFLASPAETDRVLAEDRNARRLGINAIPCFIFERHYAISGAQEPEFFLPVFDLVQNGGAAAQ